jgi:hypothetical protein
MGLAYGLVETSVGLTTIAAAPIAGLLYRSAPHLPFPVSLILIAASIAISARLLPRPKSASDLTKSGRE